MYMLTFISLLFKKKRKELGFSQVRLAANANVALPTVQNLEAAKGNPSIDVLSKTLDAIGYEMKIVPRLPDWDLLFSLGVPLMEKKHYSRRPERRQVAPAILQAIDFLTQSTGAGFERQLDAVKAFVLALKTHYPSLYSGIRPFLPAHFLPLHPDGRLIKLRRIALSLLARYA